MGAAALLTILRDGEVVKKQPLEGEADVGRADGCVIRLEDRAISRQHALFRPVGDGFQVEKKSDFAPLLVNGAECTRAFLKEGDVIAIGPYQVKYSRAEAPAGATASPNGYVPMSGPEDPALAATVLVGPGDGLEDAGLPVDPGATLPSPPREDDATATAAAELRAAAGTGPAEAVDTGFDLGPVSGGAVAPPVGDSSMLLESPSGMIANGSGEPAISFSAEGEGGTQDLNMGGLGSPNMDMTGAELSMGSSSGPVDQEGSTKVMGGTDLKASLQLRSGAASTTELQIEGDEVSIGRGRDCEIIVDDKKVSRKNTTIRREGNKFIIKDLESANGTYVNGVAVKEAQLFGDDIVKIGNTEFKFVALSENYEKRKEEISEIAAAGIEGLEVPDINLPPPVEGGSSQIMQQAGPMELSVPSDLSAPPLGTGFNPPPPRSEMTPAGGIRPPVSGLSGLYPATAFGATPPPPRASGLGGTQTINVMGIPGLPGAGPMPGIPDNKPREKGLMARFRRLNKRQQYIAIALVIVVLWELGFDDEEEVAPPPVKKVVRKVEPSSVPATSGQVGTPTFDTLSPEKKRFVEAQHSLAFDYYRNQDYAKALFEIQKIFEIIPDYKDAREIERYSQEGKRKQEALEEERRKREEEQRLKAKVVQLVEDASRFMKKKQYEQAREVFSQLLALDPENVQVNAWKKEIEEWEEMQKLAEQEKQIQKELSDKAWGVYKRAMTLKRQGKYHTAIAVFSKVSDGDGAANTKLVRLAQAMIRKCRGIIAARRGPLLAQGDQAERNGEFTKALRLYGRAWQVDPGHPAAVAGLARVKRILHERAKVIYTEAVLAESYSDFETAKAKYKEIMSVAPSDDLYFERAQRKLGRYFQRGLAGEGG
jgi:pSer/pThr/pTyr-binding forkhead associated (FHA) protein/tetratricopeptide (TPR) repeat protein